MSARVLNGAAGVGHEERSDSGRHSWLDLVMEACGGEGGARRLSWCLVPPHWRSRARDGECPWVALRECPGGDQTSRAGGEARVGKMQGT